jgi:hypothetical protein
VRTVGQNGTDLVSVLAVILTGDNHRSLFASSITTEYECTRCHRVKKIKSQDLYIIPSSARRLLLGHPPDHVPAASANEGEKKTLRCNVSGVKKPNDSSTR